jgi:hypothetical protein
MDRNTLRRLQKISHRENVDKTELAQNFFSALEKTLAKRGYRADLQIATDARSTKGRFTASVKFAKQLGKPDDADLMALVAQTYPTHQIDWNLVQIDPAEGIVIMPLEPSVEVVPLTNISSIPPEFKPIGTALYLRAADTSGKINEVWTLKKDSDGGLMLYRNQDDLEVTAETETEIKAGDAVNTPHGPGRVVRFDEGGNAFVQVGNQKRLVARDDMTPYKKEKEEKKLVDLYTQIYGDAQFAKELVKDYGRKDKR